MPARRLVPKGLLPGDVRIGFQCLLVCFEPKKTCVTGLVTVLVQGTKTPCSVWFHHVAEQEYEQLAGCLEPPAATRIKD